MRRSAILISLLALLLLTAALAPFFKSDPGLVLIHFRDWTIEMSVLVLLGGFLVTWIVVQFAALAVPAAVGNGPEGGGKAGAGCNWKKACSR